MNIETQEMWRRYAEKENLTTPFEAWSFGDDADNLATLVLNGMKTATSSAYDLYALTSEELPKAGEYSVILDSQEKPVCIIRTDRVFVIPFCEVGARQAWREGEGDRSLSYWRIVHERFFRNELAAFGIPFDETILVVCEEFIRVFP